METICNKNKQIVSSYKYNCILCGYNTSKKCNYTDHLMSRKHLKKQDENENQQKYNSIISHYNNSHDISSEQNIKSVSDEEHKINQQKNSSQNNMCNTCGKVYNNRSGLWRHKKKCIENDIDNYNVKELMKYLIKETINLKCLMNEVIKKDNNN